MEAWQSISPELIQKSFRACGQSREEAFACVSQFWDEDLEYFEKTTTAESQLVTAENHFHENNELFLIDDYK